ncbi:hypothetical protein BC830DRAFT_1251010 [Chytriomyces sp. MP71]|nr:hypothetical protein BC830DRAFT_1251010 [Chytriomyces sp. MP71]
MSLTHAGYQRIPAHDAVLSIPTSASTAPMSLSGRQPKRTTKTSQKQVLFPADAEADEQDLHHQMQMQQAAAYKTTQKEEFLRRVSKESLPRATAYCTCSRYNLDQLSEYLFSRKVTNGTAPRRYDEALYTPYSFAPFSFSQYESGVDPAAMDEATVLASVTSSSDHMTASALNDAASFKIQMAPAVVDMPTQPASMANTFANGAGSFADAPASVEAAAPPPVQNLRGGTSYGDFSDTIEAVGSGSYKDLVRRTTVPELFFFDFGVVVMWGLTEEEEFEILQDIRPFEEESIDHNDVESEKFHYLYSRQQQARIYNDIITLISPTSSVMIKLTISHAFAQSAKLTLFEGLIEETIESTRRIPTVMAETGKIHMHRKAINKKIGQLFIMRINVNLVSNVLDTPEIFWSEPAFEPLYTAIRGYLEINQRVDLVNQRVAVISDLLAMLKDNLTSTHGEQLEWIVIFLISLEIVIGLITISIDLSSYYGAHPKGGPFGL